MQKSRKIALMAFALAAIGANVNFSFTRTNAADTSLGNLVALQSAATEAYCDQTHQNSCTMRVGDLIGTSTGNMIIIH